MMGEIMKRGKNTSVKWKMVGMILLYWALPFVLMLALVGHIMADRQEKTGLERMAAQLEMDNQNSIERIDSAISDSRQATYDKTLYSYYDEFRKGSVNQEGMEAWQDSTGNLRYFSSYLHSCS